MSVRNVLLETTTINSGSTVKSDMVLLDEEEAITLQIEGDADSQNLNFTLQVKVDPNDNWAKLDALNSQDLTNHENNSRVYQYDVLDLERLRVKTKNNFTASTDVKIISQHTPQQ